MQDVLQPVVQVKFLSCKHRDDDHSNLFLGDLTDGRGWLENFSRKSFLNIKGKIFLDMTRLLDLLFLLYSNVVFSPPILAKMKKLK